MHVFGRRADSRHHFFRGCRSFKASCHFHFERPLLQGWVDGQMHLHLRMDGRYGGARYNPATRPSAAQALEHAYFRSAPSATQPAQLLAVRRTLGDDADAELSGNERPRHVPCEVTKKLAFM